MSALEREQARNRQLEEQVSSLTASGLAPRTHASPLPVDREELRFLAEKLDEIENPAGYATPYGPDVDRAGALEHANSTLARLNAELSRRVEEESSARVAAQAQLFQAQKLEAIGQLTGGIAHDFNNLLTVVTSGLQLLSRTRDEEHRQRLIRRVEEAAWRGADLTRRLLAFARRQPLNPQPLDLTRHFEGLRELLRHGIRDDITIETTVAAGLWSVQADLGALELAVLNLAVNARDAMPKGGRLALGARNVPDETGRPRQYGLTAGDYVEIFVTDTGTGMSDDVLARVFEPFFTTKPAGKGTGLGLAQVYGFAHQSGGTARVESRQGQGTTVSILLPRAVITSQPPSPDVESEPWLAQPQEHLSVLVVEDDDEVAAMVVDMLDQLGHQPLRVSTLAAAVAVLSGGERLDLIFTDVLLPGGGSGLDLAREVSRRRLKIPVVLTSGYGGGMTGRLAAAKLPFLRKPYTLAMLRQVVESASTFPIHELESSN
ncbi:MAG TPA: ATP-binding protein [Acetobacteraceae bacterium]